MRPRNTRYRVEATRRARRQLAEHLPESAAVAAFEFLAGPLAENPHRVGKRLDPPMADLHSAHRGPYRIIYRIDEDAHTVWVVTVEHRRDAYRTHQSK